MNRLCLSILFTIASTSLAHLNSMKRTHEALENHHVQQNQKLLTAQQQEKSITELLCCLNFNEIPTDLDPIIIKLIVVMEGDKHFKTTLDTNSPARLSNSLITICNNLPSLDGRFMPYEELAGLVACTLAKGK